MNTHAAKTPEQIKKEINGIFHIAVYKDEKGYFYPGLYRMDKAPSGAKRVLPVVTFDAPVLETEEMVFDMLKIVFLNMPLADVQAEMLELPKDALKYLELPEPYAALLLKEAGIPKNPAGAVQNRQKGR
ncbi:MAG: hypothetical protein LBH41_01125 [Rickettsiales bacterium]|nr:hypothetical protein [Rickettsiales bacterium]